MMFVDHAVHYIVHLKPSIVYNLTDIFYVSFRGFQGVLDKAQEQGVQCKWNSFGTKTAVVFDKELQIEVEVIV